MKKRLIIITAAFILALSAAGCGQTNNGTASNTTKKEQQTDVSGAYENGANAGNSSAEQNYSEAVDMDKVEGTEAVSDNDKKEFEGKLGASEVSIGDAKVIKYEDDDVIVVSFEYKNNSDRDQSFNGMFDVIAAQNDTELPPATVVGVEGVELLSMAEYVPTGKTITVQKAYKLRDSSAPVTVELKEFNNTEDSSESLVKTFSF